MKTFLFIFGTRPEAIKIAPVIRECLKCNGSIRALTCLTGQHKEMIDQVVNFFNIPVNYSLDIMQPNQTLNQIAAGVLNKLPPVIRSNRPDMIFVQGDTTSAFAGALAGYYEKVPVAHIEAGLRSADKFSPYPEEINRTLIGHIADIHFAPTQKAVENMKREGIEKNVWCVGNTVIDALVWALEIIEQADADDFIRSFAALDFSRRIVLITGHRRENFGIPFENICRAIKHLADNNPDIQFVYPVHLNPNVRAPVFEILGSTGNVFLIEPLSYPRLVWLLKQSYLVLTDSGGIQEEAPSMGKPVLVMRDVTERMEGIEAGTALLVGSDPRRIIDEVQNLLDNKNAYARMSNAQNPYGDGTAARQIMAIIAQGAVGSNQ